MAFLDLGLDSHAAAVTGGRCFAREAMNSEPAAQTGERRADSQPQEVAARPFRLIRASLHVDHPLKISNQRGDRFAFYDAQRTSGAVGERRLVVDAHHRLECRRRVRERGVDRGCGDVSKWKSPPLWPLHVGEDRLIAPLAMCPDSVGCRIGMAVAGHLSCDELACIGTTTLTAPALSANR